MRSCWPVLINKENDHAGQRSLSLSRTQARSGWKAENAPRSSVTSRSFGGADWPRWSLNFVRYFWHTLEPKTRALVEGWPLEAICLHLEALTFGDIPSNRL